MAQQLVASKVEAEETEEDEGVDAAPGGDAGENGEAGGLLTPKVEGGSLPCTLCTKVLASKWSFYR